MLAEPITRHLMVRIENDQASGRLHHVIYDFHRLTQHILPSNVHDLFQACPYIGRCSISVMYAWDKELPPVIHLSIYEIDNLSLLVQPRIKLLVQIARYLIRLTELPGDADAITSAQEAINSYIDIMGLHAIQYPPDYLAEETAYGVYGYDPFA